MAFCEIICLANSKKYQARCVAGLCTDGRGWVRPIGPNEHGTLDARHYTLDDGSEARVLDLLRIELDSPRPEPHQPENWLVGQARWKLIARPAPKSRLGALRDGIVTGPALLGSQSDRTPYAAFRSSAAEASLALIRPMELEWLVTTSPRGKPQVRALFKLGGAPYSLSVTDPIWERKLSGRRVGKHPLASTGLNCEDVLLTISLGEPFQDQSCYKLVAAVIPLPTAWRAAL